MAEFTYEPEKRTALARVRHLANDTDPDDLLYRDREWEMALRESAASDFLYCYLDTTATVNSGITAATIEVRNGTSEVEAVFTRTGTGGDVFTAGLSVSTEYDAVWELIQAVEARNTGWRFDLSLGRYLDPTGSNTAPRTYDDRFAADDAEAIALRRPSADIALTGSALDVFGVAAVKRLLAYDVRAAAYRGLAAKFASLREPEEYSEGDVRWSRPRVAQQMKTLAGRVNVLAVDAFGGGL